MRITVLCIFLALLTACGVRGKLYLPNQAKPAPEENRPVMMQDPYSPQMNGNIGITSQSDKE